MARNTFPLLICIITAGCGGGGDGIDANADPGPYQLIFSLDASFHADHGGQPISIALVRLTDDMVIAEDSGTVSATANPSFLFTTNAIMERGISYAVHYWIDSNIGGGNIGTCDPIEIDHQWSVEFNTPTNDINFTVGYQPNLAEDVCNTFS